MAIWQFKFIIIPKGRQKEAYLEEQLISWQGIEISTGAIEKLSKILPKKKSWAKDIEQYGSIDSTCIEFLYEDNHIVEMNGRLDLRNLSKVMLTEIVAYINMIEGDILYQNKIYKAQLDIIIELLKSSQEAKFCSNPKEYFKILSNTVKE